MQDLARTDERLETVRVLAGEGVEGEEVLGDGKGGCYRGAGVGGAWGWEVAGGAVAGVVVGLEAEAEVEVEVEVDAGWGLDGGRGRVGCGGRMGVVVLKGWEEKPVL